MIVKLTDDEYNCDNPDWQLEESNTRMLLTLSNENNW